MEVAVTTARAPAVLKKVIYPYRERIHPSKVIFLGQSPLGREPSQRHLWSCTCKWNDLKVNILPRKIIVFWHGTHNMIQDLRTPFYWRNVNVSSSQYECYIFTSSPSHHFLDHAGMNVFSAGSDLNLSQKSNFGNYTKRTRGATTICHFENNQQMGRVPLISCVVHRCGDQ